MLELIEHTINKIDDLIKEQLTESKYQFEFYDLATKENRKRNFTSNDVIASTGLEIVKLYEQLDTQTK